MDESVGRFDSRPVCDLHGFSACNSAQLSAKKRLGNGEQKSNVALRNSPSGIDASQRKIHEIFNCDCCIVAPER